MATFVDDHYSMRPSNDSDRSGPIGLSSLGVVDLDTSIVPDVFGLRAFDSGEPISLMLPGQFPNELRVLMPDAGAAPVAFHDIIITDLGATPEWRTRRIVTGEVTLLRRCWPKIVFTTMHRRQIEMENICRSCKDRTERAFSQGWPGHCPQCNEYVMTTLDKHMMNNHLELGQLWRVRWIGVLYGRAQWATVWIIYVRNTVDHSLWH